MIVRSFLQNCSFNSDPTSQPTSEWVQQLREELMVSLSLARATNAGGIDWCGDVNDNRGLALDQVPCVLRRL